MLAPCQYCPSHKKNIMGNWIRDISLRYKFWAVNAVAFFTTLLLVLHALFLEQQGRAEDARAAAEAQAQLLRSWPADQALPSSPRILTFATGSAPQLPGGQLLSRANGWVALEHDRLFG